MYMQGDGMDGRVLDMRGTETPTCKELIEAVGYSILEGEAEDTMRLVEQAVRAGIDVEELIVRALVGSMSRVGRDFKNGEFYIPDVLLSSRAAQAAVFKLRSLGLVADESDQDDERGTVVVGTVAGDLHDIGKNITVLMLQVNDFNVIDLGIDVVPEVFVEAVRKHRPMLLGVSSLLTTTISEMGHIVEALVKAGLRDEVKIYVSGAPVTQEFADMIGADHYSPDVRDSIEYAKAVFSETVCVQQ